jgi:hypothetical protein
LLDENDLAYAFVSSFSSAPRQLGRQLNRARRKGRAFENPLESPFRVAGAQVVVETAVPVREIEDLVRGEFVVDAEGSLSVDEAAARTELLTNPRDVDELQYDYPFYLVSIDDRRLELSEWARFAGLKVRIEVKTALQHAWALIDEELPFYGPGAYPAEARELLARSALAAASIDRDLAEAKHTVWRLLAEYEEAVAAGDLRLPLNGVSLLAYIRTSELVRSLVELGQDVGLEPAEGYEPSFQDIEQALLWLLAGADLHTIAELEDFLRQATPRARTLLADLNQLANGRGVRAERILRRHRDLALARPAPRRLRHAEARGVRRRAGLRAQHADRESDSGRRVRRPFASRKL